MQVGECVGAVEGAEQVLGAGLDEGGEGDGEFADAQPAGAAGEVGREGEVGHWLEGEGVGEEGVVAPFFGVRGLGGGGGGAVWDDGCRGRGMRKEGWVWGCILKVQTFERGGCAYGGWDGPFPEEVADEVVFADVLAEEIDSRRVLCWRSWGSGQGVEVRATEHVAFPDDAGCDGDGADGGVEFRVRGREEEFFEEGAPGGGASLLFALVGSWNWRMGVAVEGWE